MVAPAVMVESDGSLIAGANHSLQCEVETVVGVRPGDITISWTTPDGTLIETDSLTTEGNVIRGTLELSPLTTSDAGSYTCTGRILADSVQVYVSSNSIIELYVTSKFSPTHMFISHCLSFSLSPSSRGGSDCQYWQWPSGAGDRAGHLLLCFHLPCCQY